ncbi:hypothetical protein B0J14DRAFT_643409 [Halenospora varia]|nr:hypothetical protein B0J14DRAFT_643409 [Halenospora varia]
MGVARPLNTELTPEHYHQHRQRLVEQGIVKKKHAPSTKNNINGLKKKWTEHCTFFKKDRLQFLRLATKEDIMIFMKWILDNYPRYINGYLTTAYGLDLSMREKMVMNVDDVYITLHHHWILDVSIFPDGRQRLQLAFLVLVSAYTASRPGALVYVKRNIRVKKRAYLTPDDSSDEMDADEMDVDDDPTNPEEDVEALKTLCYEDVTLVLLPNPRGIRDILAIEVNLQYTKGHHKKPKRKVFLFSEVNDLVFDAIILMLTIAIHDNAFRSEKIQSVRDIFRLRVKQPRYSLELKWKKSILKTPIFRQAVLSVDGTRTSSPEDAKALWYYTYIYYLQRLGYIVGFAALLTGYALRRGAGEVLDALASQGILQQVMNHKDAGIFQAYMNERVQFDVQAAFLGRPSSDAAMKATSHGSRYIDPRAPTTLDASCQQPLRTHPTVVKCRQLRDSLSVEARRVKLRRGEVKKSRDEFFDTIDTDEIDKQLDLSLLDLEEKHWKPKAVEHILPERKRVAELICERPADSTKEAALEHRILTIEALVALCRVREAQPQQTRAYDRTWGIMDEDTATLVEPNPLGMIYSSKQCPFCFKEFCRPCKMREHAENQHLKLYKVDELIPCPNPVCDKEGVILNGHEHFKNHAATVHDSFLFDKYRK